MSKSQLHPLKVNPSTGEPFLPLDSHPGFIITPPRLSDIVLLPDLLNDPNVHPWLKGPPYPYTLEHSRVWVTEKVEEATALLQELESSSEGSLKVVDGCPIRYIREVKEDGTDVLVGDIELRRFENMELAPGSNGVDLGRAPRLLDINNQRKAGDPEIIWSMGYLLASSYGGRGIMSSAFKAVIQQWAIPRMGMRRMVGVTYPDNYGSRKVMEKNGFVLREIVKEHVKAKGKVHDSCVYDLNVAV
ncbi:GNAT domain-containing protein [Rhodocollybia butyracea]|uniref:GNAT domain-containing protein n=1 Tax=Rhodocollybia butyracea TaxID=206335 RepID=A0A9P5Q6H1_9AGAR|nr:GNAT domain-containing protein [Rhodocollybia butyracea]